jgi:RHS repeat-associated protein
MEGLNSKSEARNSEQIQNPNAQNSKQDILTTLDDHINEFNSWQMFDLDDNPKKGPSEPLSFSGEPQLSTANSTIGYKALNDTYYIYSFDGKLLAEYDTTGNCTREYIYLGNRIVAEYQPGSNQYYYYMSDQINTTRLVTDGSGNIVYSAAYGPYGDVQKIWMNTYDPKMKFSGKEREVFGSLDYFGARYYNNTQHRFLSVDPIINKDKALNNPQYWNLYAYCGNNPITYLDPDGRDTICSSGWTHVQLAWTVGHRDANRIAGRTALGYTIGIPAFIVGLFAPEIVVGIGSKIAPMAPFLARSLTKVNKRPQISTDVMIKGKKFFDQWANRNAYDQAVRQLGKFTEFSLKVPGEIKGSFTKWVKVLDPAGGTIKLYHDTFDKIGKFISRGIKVPGPERHVK